MLKFQSERRADKKDWIKSRNGAGFFLPIVVSVLGVLAWLVFALFFALFWSRGYGLFQDIVVLLASLGIMGLLIALMWIIWGRNRMHWWARQF